MLEESSSDSFNNYEILSVIRKGETSTVHIALCRRGRLRGRKVAMKQIDRKSGSSQSLAHLKISTTVHLSLHHPAIVSLFSSFSSATHDYHVMELCSRGTLFSFLQSRTTRVLSECEVRGVSKSLIEALIYLRKELIVHRDINPTNLLITVDYRIKLSGFGLAMRLPSFHSTVTTSCGLPNYQSPEVLSRTPYSFPADIWSAGCVMLACLTGKPPFDADSVSGIFQNIRLASQILPKKITEEAADLLSQLLQKKSKHRITVDRILSHPFYDAHLPIRPIGPSLNKISNSLVQEKIITTHVRQSPSFNDAKSSARPKSAPDSAFLHNDSCKASKQRIVSDPLPRGSSLGAELNALRNKRLSLSEPFNIRGKEHYDFNLWSSLSSCSTIVKSPIILST